MSKFDYTNIDKPRFAAIYAALVEADAINEYFLTPTEDKVIIGVHKALRGAVTDLNGKHHVTDHESRKYNPLIDDDYTADVIANVADYIFHPDTNPSKRHGAFAEFSDFYAPVPEKTVQALELVASIADNKNWSLDPWRYNHHIAGHWEHSVLRYNAGSPEERMINVGVSSAGVVSIDRSPHYRNIVVSIENPKLVSHALEERILREETQAQLNKLYGYIVDDVSSDSVSADVVTYNNRHIFNIFLDKDFKPKALTEYGMHHIDDVEALTKHLKQLTLISEDSVVLPEVEFEKKRDELQEQISLKISKLDTVIVNDMIETSAHVIAEVYGYGADKFFLSLTDGKEYGVGAVRSIIRSPALEASINSMDRTEHTMLMRSKNNGGTDNNTIWIPLGQDIRQVAGRVADSYGAEVVSIDGIDFTEIKKHKRYLNIQIDNTRNSSFEDIGEMAEVERVLVSAKNLISGVSGLSEADGKKLTDTNGNVVGFIKFTDHSQPLKAGNIRIELETTSLNSPDKVIPFINAAIEGIQNGKKYFQLRTDDSNIEIAEEYKNLPKVAQVFVVGDPVKNKVHTYDTGLEL